MALYLILNTSFENKNFTLQSAKDIYIPSHDVCNMKKKWKT